MSSLTDVFRVIARMRDEGIVLEYALGGATAVLFYAEPTRTYDLDVFAILPSDAMQSLGPLPTSTDGRNARDSRSSPNT